MNNLKNTNALVMTALFTALTCIATMVIQIPTPTLGYIHFGDTLVILSGALLGPVLGGFAAGIGSMLADILSGYVIYALPTLIIKALSAVIAGVLFLKLQRTLVKNKYYAFLIAGIFAEINVVFGYFINKIVKTMFMAGLYNKETFAAGLTSAVAGIAPNVLQGAVGIILSLSLFPLLIKAIGYKKSAFNI